MFCICISNIFVIFGPLVLILIFAKKTFNQFLNKQKHQMVKQEFKN